MSTHHTFPSFPARPARLGSRLNEWRTLPRYQFHRQLILLCGIPLLLWGLIFYTSCQRPGYIDPPALSAQMPAPWRAAPTINWWDWYRTPGCSARTARASLVAYKLAWAAESSIPDREATARIFRIQEDLVDILPLFGGPEHLQQLERRGYDLLPVPDWIAPSRTGAAVAYQRSGSLGMVVVQYLQADSTPGTYLFHELQIASSLYDSQRGAFQQWGRGPAAEWVERVGNQSSSVTSKQGDAVMGLLLLVVLGAMVVPKQKVGIDLAPIMLMMVIGVVLVVLLVTFGESIALRYEILGDCALYGCN